MSTENIVVITAAVFFLTGYLMAWRDYRRAIRKFGHKTPTLVEETGDDSDSVSDSAY